MMDKRMELARLRDQLAKVYEMEKRNEERNRNIIHHLEELEEKDALYLHDINRLNLIKDNYKTYLLKMWPLIRESQAIKNSLRPNILPVSHRAKPDQEIPAVSKRTTISNNLHLSSWSTEWEPRLEAGATTRTPTRMTSTPKSNRSNATTYKDETMAIEELVPEADQTNNQQRLESVLEFTKCRQLTTVHHPVLTCRTPNPMINQRIESTIEPLLEDKPIKMSPRDHLLSETKTVVDPKVKGLEESVITSQVPEKRTENFVDEATDLKPNEMPSRESPVAKALLSVVSSASSSSSSTTKSDKSARAVEAANAYEKFVQSSHVQVQSVVEKDNSSDDDDLENEMVAIVNRNPMDEVGRLPVSVVPPTANANEESSSSSNDTPVKELKPTISKLESAKSLPTKGHNLQKKKQLKALALDSDSDVPLPDMTKKSNNKDEDDDDDFSFFD